MGKISVTHPFVKQDGASEEPNFTTPAASRTMPGRENTQTAHSDYSFSFPDGTKVIRVYYATWVFSNGPTELFIFLNQKCAMGFVDYLDVYTKTPLVFSAFSPTYEHYGCIGLSVQDNTLHFIANSPTVDAGGSDAFGVKFEAFI